MGFYKNPLKAQATSFIIFPFPVQRVTKLDSVEPAD